MSAMREVRQLVLRHTVALHQFENGLRARAEVMVRAALREVTAQLQQFPNLKSYERQRVLALQARFQSLIASRFTDFQQDLSARLAGLSGVETRFAERVLQASAKSVGVEIGTTQLTQPQLASIVKLPIDGALQEDWWKNAANNLSFGTRRQLQIGLLRGESSMELASRVQSTGEMSVNTAKMLVRTATTHVSATTNVETFAQQDPEVTSQYQYVATLDERTSLICAELDGQIFDYSDESAPRPPMHPNCRSTIIPVVNWEALGVSKPPEDLLEVTRAAEGGPTSYRTYGTWLRDQDAGTQNDILGPSRGKLFRDGDVSLKELLASDGSVLTLDQLAKKLDL